MAYRDDVLALSPDHLWRFDADFIDSAGTLDATNVGFGTAAVAICEDAVNSVQCNGTSDRVTLPSSVDVDGALDRKVVCGWIRLSSIQLPPKSLYREGANGNYLCFVVWAGNNLMLDISNSGAVRQAFSKQVCQPSRDYFIAAYVEGSGFGNTVSLYVDGVEQSSVPLNAALLNARAGADFGDPESSTDVGNLNVLLNGPTNCNYGYWATFSGANIPTPSEIRTELFEKGALPDVTITNQAGLDALADTIRPDAPLCIRVDVAGSITLTADNIRFDPLASIHVQYTGTGTLSWVNTNGSAASIGSTPNGGTINFINPATLTISGLVSGSEVRFYEAGTTTELAGIESSGTVFSSSVQAASVDARILALGYENKAIKAIDMSGGDVTAVAGQVIDRQYRND